MLSKTHHDKPARTRTLLFAVVWTAAFAVGLVADVRFPGGADMLFDGDLTHVRTEHAQSNTKPSDAWSYSTS